MNLSFWDSFRDEILATGLVLILTAGGSFFLVDFISRDNNQINKTSNDQTNTLGLNTKEIDVEESDRTVLVASPSIMVQPTILPTPTPTPNINMSEMTYGFEGSYGYDEYHLKLLKPRIEYNSVTNTGRKLKVDIVLRNVKVNEGLVNRITASIVKDGKLIVKDAVLSVSESKTVMPGEQLTFTASLALIEGTDVSTIDFRPGGNYPQVSHSLK